MKVTATAAVIATTLAIFNPAADAKLRGRHLDMNDDLGGLAGALTSPAAFQIANWGQRVGPFVGPMKNAIGSTSMTCLVVHRATGVRTCRTDIV